MAANPSPAVADEKPSPTATMATRLEIDNSPDSTSARPAARGLAPFALNWLYEWCAENAVPAGRLIASAVLE